MAHRADRPSHARAPTRCATAPHRLPRLKTKGDLIDWADLLQIILAGGFLLLSNAGPLLKKLREQRAAKAQDRTDVSAPARDRSPARPQTDTAAALREVMQAVAGELVEDDEATRHKLRSRLGMVNGRLLGDAHKLVDALGEPQAGMARLADLHADLLEEYASLKAIADDWTPASPAWELEHLGEKVTDLVTGAQALNKLIGQRTTAKRSEQLADAEAMITSLIQPMRQHLDRHDLLFLGADPVASLDGSHGGGESITFGVFPKGRAVVVVPRSFGSELFRYASVPHELAHLLLRAIPGLWEEVRDLSGLAGIAPDALSAPNGQLDGSLAQPAVAWLEEIVCDLMTVLQLGPAAVMAFHHVFQRSHDVDSVLRAPTRYGSYLPHPPAHLRMLLCCAVLDRMGFSQDARSLQAAWMEAHDEPTHLLLGSTEGRWLRLPVDALLPPLVEIVHRLYDSQFEAVGGRQLVSVPGFEMAPGLWARVQRLADSLADGESKPNDARLALAAGLVARHREPEAADAIAWAMRHAVFGDSAAEQGHHRGTSRHSRAYAKAPHRAPERQPVSKRRLAAESLVLRELLGPAVGLTSGPPPPLSGGAGRSQIAYTVVLRGSMRVFTTSACACLCLLACTGPTDKDAVHDTPDSDTTQDTLPPVHTDTDSEVPIDTDDTEAPPLPAGGPPDLGAGFVLEDIPPALAQIEGATGPEMSDQPVWHPAVFAQLDTDPELEVVLSLARDQAAPDGSLGRCRGVTLDRQPDGSWGPFAPLPCLVWSGRSAQQSPLRIFSLAAIDLDQDGIDELLWRYLSDIRLYAWREGTWQESQDVMVTDDPCRQPINDADAWGVADLNHDGRYDIVRSRPTQVDDACEDASVVAWIQTDTMRFEPTDWLDGPPDLRIHGVAYLHNTPTETPAVCFAASGGQPEDPHCFRPNGMADGDPTFEAYMPFAAFGRGNHPMGAESVLLDDQTCPSFWFTAGDVETHLATDAVDPSVCASNQDEWFDTTATLGLASPLMHPTARFTPWGVEGNLDLDGDGCLDAVVNNGRDIGEWFNDTRSTINHPIAHHNVGCHEGASRFVPWPGARVGELYGPLQPMGDHNRDGVVDANDRYDFNLDGAVTLDDTAHHFYEGGGLQCADMDGDGDSDCLFSGAYLNPPLLMRNDAETEHHLLTVRLHGQTSDPIGARVELTWPDTVLDADDAPQTTRCPYGTGSGPNAIVASPCTFGLAEHDTAELTVHWTSGFVQEVGPVQAGQRIEVVEPQLVHIADPTLDPGLVRRELTVCPFLPDGLTLDPDATVTLTPVDHLGGTSSLSPPELQASGCFTSQHAAFIQPVDTPYADVARTRVTVSLTYGDGTELTLATQPMLLHRDARPLTFTPAGAFEP